MTNPIVWLAFAVVGWLAGIAINHIANVLPLQQRALQPPFCKRRVDVGAPEGISTAQKGDESLAEPVYCRFPRPRPAWSALLAYLTGNQTCPACGKPVGARPVMVELFTPALFVLLQFRYPLSVHLAFLLLYTIILIVLTVTDLEHRLIPHKLVVPAIGMAVAGSFFSTSFNWKQAVLGGALAFVIFYGLAIISRGGLGGGDVTLAAFLGLITGFPNVILALLYGILLGGVVSGGLLLFRRATLKTFIPYGPFLIVSGWIVLVWGQTLSAAVWR